MTAFAGAFAEKFPMAKNDEVEDALFGTNFVNIILLKLFGGVIFGLDNALASCIGCTTSKNITTILDKSIPVVIRLVFISNSLVIPRVFGFKKYRRLSP